MTYDKNTIVFEPLPNHPRFIDLTGHIYDFLTVLGFCGRKGSRKQFAWWCECECGQITIQRSAILRTQESHHSCGCHRHELTRQRLTIHNESGKNVTPEYSSYRHAKERCEKVTHHAYKRYGGRGIKFLFDDYPQFLQIMGRKPSPQHSLDRIDNDGHYEPNNCRWATKKEQASNRVNSHMITLNGITQTFSEWSRVVGMPLSRTSMRLRHGYCTECIFMLPKGEVCVHR